MVHLFFYPYQNTMARFSVVPLPAFDFTFFKAPFLSVSVGFSSYRR